MDNHEAQGEGAASTRARRRGRGQSSTRQRRCGVVQSRTRTGTRGSDTVAAHIACLPYATVAALANASPKHDGAANGDGAAAALPSAMVSGC